MTFKLLRPKYRVLRLDDEGCVEPDARAMDSTDPENIDSPFVLMPRKDPAAFYAMMHYASSCEHELAREIESFLRKVAEAEPKYGTQGMRNRTKMRLEFIRQVLYA